MLIYVFVYAINVQCPRMPEEGVGSLGARVAEPLMWMLGNQTQLPLPQSKHSSPLRSGEVSVLVCISLIPMFPLVGKLFLNKLEACCVLTVTEILLCGEESWPHLSGV